MALLLDNDAIGRILSVPAAVDAIEEGMKQLAHDEAAFHRRKDIWSPTPDQNELHRFGIQFGAIRYPPRLALRCKSSVLRWRHGEDSTVREKYNVEPGTYMGFILLFDTSTGSLLGIMNDGVIQHIRTGATAGVACKYLAREDARTLGVLGSGGMARTYTEAIASVRDLTDIKVYSPTAEHRKSFAEEMREKLSVDVTAVEDAKTAVGEADIVATCTNASEPIFDHQWIEPGQLLINVNPAEMDDMTFDQVDRVLITTNEPIEERQIGTTSEYSMRPGGSKSTSKNYQEVDYPTILDVLREDDPGRTSDSQTILYNNVAIGGVQFAILGGLVHEEASQQGLGTEIPLSWFQQEEKN